MIKSEYSVLPSNFPVDFLIKGTVFKCEYMESVLTNIIIVSKKLNDYVWTPFTIEQYYSLGNNTVKGLDWKLLNILVRGYFNDELYMKNTTEDIGTEYLLMINEGNLWKYSVSLKLLELLKPYAKSTIKKAP